MSDGELAKTKADLETDLQRAKEEEQRLRDEVHKTSKLFGDVSAWLFAASHRAEPGMEFELARLEVQIADNFNDYIKCVDISAADKLKDELERAARRRAEIEEKIAACDG